MAADALVCRSHLSFRLSLAKCHSACPSRNAGMRVDCSASRHFTNRAAGELMVYTCRDSRREWHGHLRPGPSRDSAMPGTASKVRIFEEVLPGERAQTSDIRLSRPASAALVPKVAKSLGDRIRLEGGHEAAAPGELSRLLDSMSDVQRLALARHALEAALEALESDPQLSSGLLPSTASTVRAQIAGGCIAYSGAAERSYVVVEIDIAVWQQLLQADRRAVPIDTLDPDEAADRKRLVLEELAIDIDDLNRYRKDERVVMALRDLES